MAKPMRYLVLIVLCLSMVLGGPVSAAACATACVDPPTTVQSGTAAGTDCDKSQNTHHKCSHDACCGYQLAAISEVTDFATTAPPRTVPVASVRLHLIGSGWETLLDPPRA